MKYYCSCGAEFGRKAALQAHLEQTGHERVDGPSAAAPPPPPPVEEEVPTAAYTEWTPETVGLMAEAEEPLVTESAFSFRLNIDLVGIFTAFLTLSLTLVDELFWWIGPAGSWTRDHLTRLGRDLFFTAFLTSFTALLFLTGVVLGRVLAHYPSFTYGLAFMLSCLAMAAAAWPVRNMRTATDP